MGESSGIDFLRPEGDRPISSNSSSNEVRRLIAHLNDPSLNIPSSKSFVLLIIAISATLSASSLLKIYLNPQKSTEIWLIKIESLAKTMAVIDWAWREVRCLGSFFPQGKRKVAVGPTGRVGEALGVLEIVWRKEWLVVPVSVLGFKWGHGVGSFQKEHTFLLLSPNFIIYNLNKKYPYSQPFYSPSSLLSSLLFRCCSCPALFLRWDQMYALSSS